MGWLSIEFKGDELFYSDTALDICDEFLTQLSVEYLESELKRLPKLNEVIKALEIVLSSNTDKYCSEMEGIIILELLAKTKKQKMTRKVMLGDIISIPLIDNVYGFAQILEVAPYENSIIGVLPLVCDKSYYTSLLNSLNFIGQLNIEYTGVLWNHWRVVGNLPINPNVELEEFSSTKPCFIAELAIIEILRRHNVLPQNSELYIDVNSRHPVRRSEERKYLLDTVRFLKDFALLSSYGINRLPLFENGAEKRLTSNMLTEIGNKFYRPVFKKYLLHDYLWTDTYERLKGLYLEFTEKGSISTRDD